MLFNTIDYFLFFLLFFVVYWFVLGKRLPLQNLFILVASYVFYGWWDWKMLSLLFLTSLSSYYAAIHIERRPSLKRYILGWTLLLNFAILIYFKYAGFFLEGLTDVAEIMGLKIGFVFANIVLPVGISFYTFQSLSYVIDVYRGQLKASESFIECAAFISFFPQLVAGPIERAPNLLKQIQSKRTFDINEAKDGLRYILWGLFKKMMVADNCSAEVERIFAHAQDMSSPMLWLGVFLFSVQIYCDFSGYTDIAIGSGKLLGVNFMQNFNFPYFSHNIKVFWKRWHISLTSWFKDYVFIPLGGSQTNKFATYKNVLIVFLLSGLWHGANYTFIAWGAYHAMLYIAYVYFFEKNKIVLPKVIAIPMTFLSVLIGWVFFRSADLKSSIFYLKGMFLCNTTQGILPLSKAAYFTIDPKIILSILILFLVEWISRQKRFGLDIGQWSTSYIRWLVYFLLIFLIIVYGNFNEQAFIYFNF